MSELVEVRIGAQLGAGGKIANTRVFFSTGVAAGTPLTFAELLEIANTAADSINDNVSFFPAATRQLSTTAQGANIEANPDYSAGPPEVGLPFVTVYDTIRVGNSAPVIGNGTRIGTALPPQNAVVVTLRTSEPGRARRGRMYWFPPTEADVDEVGQITGTNMKTVTDDLLTAVSSAVIGALDLEAVVVSNRLGDFAPIVSTDQGSRIDTQRRRLPDSIR